MVQNWKEWIEGLDPANFAFIMATGIISIILLNLGFPVLSNAFFWLDAACYIILFFLFCVRLFMMARAKKVLRELTDTAHMFKYFTFSAGSNILATRFSYAGDDAACLLLGGVGIISTIALIYIIFCTLFFHTIASIQTVSPVWLLMTIACHSSGICISTLWSHQFLVDPFFLVLSFGLLTFGLFAYGIFMALNIYRMFFLTFTGKDLNPAYWTCMGAAAIAVVDGSKLILLSEAPNFIELVKPFLGGVVLMLWAWGTAWIPILCMMELWRYGYFKMAPKYAPPMWAIVFPLGMYTSATHFLIFDMNLSLPERLAGIFMWITILAWGIIIGMSKLKPFQCESK